MKEVVERLQTQNCRVVDHHSDERQADIKKTETCGKPKRAAFRASARGGRPRAAHDVGRVVELGYRGQSYKLTVAKVDPDRYRVELDGSHVNVDVDRLSALESRLTVCHERYSVVASHASRLASGLSPVPEGLKLSVSGSLRGSCSSGSGS